MGKEGARQRQNVGTVRPERRGDKSAERYTAGEDRRTSRVSTASSQLGHKTETQGCDFIKCALINVNGSILNRTEEVGVFLQETGIQCLAITESGLYEGQKGPNIRGYQWVGRGKDEYERKGGGVGLLAQQGLNVCGMDIGADELHFWVELTVGKSKWAWCITYWRQSGAKGARDANKKLATAITNEGGKLSRRGYKVLITGDLNAHIMNRGTNWEGKDRNGKLMKDMCTEGNMELVNLRVPGEEAWTWSRGDQFSEIDFLLLGGTPRYGITNFRVDIYQEHDFNSDHNVLTWALELGEGDEYSEETEKSNPRRLPRKWNTNRDVDWEAFGLSLQPGLDEWIRKHEGNRIENGEESINRMVDEWIDCVHKAAIKTIGERQIPTKRRRGVKITTEYRRSLDRRREARKILARKIRRGGNTEEKSRLVREVRKMRREVKEVRKKEIRKARDDFMTKMDGSAKGVKEFWKYWAKIKGDKAGEVITLKDGNGNKVKGPEMGKLITKHLQKLNTPVAEGDQTAEMRKDKGGGMHRHIMGVVSELDCVSAYRT